MHFRSSLVVDNNWWTNREWVRTGPAPLNTDGGAWVNSESANKENSGVWKRTQGSSSSAKRRFVRQTKVGGKIIERF